MKSAVKIYCFSQTFFPLQFQMDVDSNCRYELYNEICIGIIKRDVGIVFCRLDIRELNGNQKVLVRIKVKWEQIDYKIPLYLE